MLDVDQIARARGHRLLDPSGAKIGDIREVYLDDDTGLPEWVLIDVGLLGSRCQFVPVQRAVAQGDDLCVPFTKAQVKAAPAVEVDHHLSAEEERLLYAHYAAAGEQGGQAGLNDPMGGPAVPGAATT